MGGGVTVEDKRADVIHAAWTAAEAAVECNPVQGVLSHQMKKHVIDGNRVIINAETPEQMVDEFEFELNEVYCIDIVISSGEGKGKETEIRNTVYKRAVE